MVFKSGWKHRSISSIIVFAILFFFFSFLPLVEVPDLVNPTQTGKFFVFSLGILVCSVFSIPYIFHSSSISINKLDLIIAVLIAFTTINRYFIQTDYNFSISYYEMLGLASLYLILRQLSAALLFYLFLAVIVGGLAHSVYGQLQLMGVFRSNHHLFRITGSFLNPGPYAGYMSSIFPIALGFYVYRQELIKPNVGNKHLVLLFTYLAALTTFFVLLVVVAAQSRASWLALLSSFLFLGGSRGALSSSRRSFAKTKVQKAALCSAIGSICLIAIMLLFHWKKDSASGRLLIWKVSWRIIRENPLWGVGIDRFRSYYMGEQAEYFKSRLYTYEVKVADNVNCAFNELIQFIAENGFLGATILLLLMYFVFSPSVSKSDKIASNRLRTIAISAIFAIGSFSLFSYPSEILPIKLNLILSMVAISRLLSPVIEISTSDFFFKKATAVSLSIIIILGSIVTCIKLNRMYLGFKAWDEAIAIYNSGNHGISILSYETAYPVFKKEGTFLTNYGKALSLAGRHREALTVLNKAIEYQNSIIVQTAYGDCNKAIGNYLKAESAYTNAWYMVPSRLYPQYLLAKLYLETKQRRKAVSAATVVLKTSAKIESIAVEEMKSEMRRVLDGN